MLHINLPDGSHRSFEHPITVLAVAESIGAGLAKAALAGRVNGHLVDVDCLIEEDAALQIITPKHPDALEVIRHSCAHLLAHAVKELFPTAQVTIGPVIEDGFYYDFAYERAFTPEDLHAIEARMHQIAKRKLKVSRTLMSRQDAINFFAEQGEQYKIEVIESIQSDEKLSFYSQGDFTDLCRGPHVPDTSKLKVFKLLKLAGAYWRGDAKNAMLQRIYGTAWNSQTELDDYLFRIEEAEKRDHRKLGKRFQLFHMQEEAPGMVFWHPKGWVIYQIIENYIRSVLTAQNYQEIRTPQIVDRKLWERSGHWDKFQDNMFVLQVDEQDYAVKPMNCPGHVQIFNQGLKSYRDLPLRLAEFGSCHRNEPSGSLHGLMRVRNFVQDDAHIFCAEADIQAEVAQFIELLFQVYRDFGFEPSHIKLSDRPKERVGEDAIWDKSEAALAQALNDKGLAWQLNPGEGAFYGPKIEFSLKDSLGRVWQCGTMQVDFSMPARLGAEFVAEDGMRYTPVMLHRAILGSLERFIAMLLEETAGALPLWLAPVQVVVLNISQNQAEYAESVQKSLLAGQIRAERDLRNEKIGFKIREHTLQKIPYLIIIGDREVETATITVRSRAGIDLGQLTLPDFMAQLKHEIGQKGRRL